MWNECPEHTSAVVSYLEVRNFSSKHKVLEASTINFWLRVTCTRTARTSVSKDLANYWLGSSGLHRARPHSVYLPGIWGWSSGSQSQVLQFQASVTEYLYLQVRPQLLGLLLVGSLVRLPVIHSCLNLKSQEDDKRIGIEFCFNWILRLRSSIQIEWSHLVPEAMHLKCIRVSSDLQILWAITYRVV